MSRKGGNHAVESPDGRFLYYLSKGGLWKVPAEGGEETRILESVLNDNFAIVDQGIHFIPDSKPRAVQFLSFATGKVTTTAKVAQEPAWGFSVSPDGRWLLYAQYAPRGSDLMLVENFR